MRIKVRCIVATVPQTFLTYFTTQIWLKTSSWLPSDQGFIIVIFLSHSKWGSIFR